MVNLFDPLCREPADTVQVTVTVTVYCRAASINFTAAATTFPRSSDSYDKSGPRAAATSSDAEKTTNLLRSGRNVQVTQLPVINIERVYDLPTSLIKINMTTHGCRRW